MLVNGIEHVSRRVQIEITPKEALQALKTQYCRVPPDAFLKNGKIMTAEDTSYHGSCGTEYTVIEVSDRTLEVFKKITELEELIRKGL